MKHQKKLLRPQEKKTLSHCKETLFSSIFQKWSQILSQKLRQVLRQLEFRVGQLKLSGGWNSKKLPVHEISTFPGLNYQIYIPIMLAYIVSTLTHLIFSQVWGRAIQPYFHTTLEAACPNWLHGIEKSIDIPNAPCNYGILDLRLQ